MKIDLTNIDCLQTLREQAEHLSNDDTQPLKFREAMNSLTIAVLRAKVSLLNEMLTKAHKTTRNHADRKKNHHK